VSQCDLAWRESLSDDEGNFGVTAGIAEMLVQSHRRDGDAPLIELLPALPSAWPTGRVSGLRTRGAFEVALDWADGRLRSASARSDRGGSCVVRNGSRRVRLETRAGETLVLDRHLERVALDHLRSFTRAVSSAFCCSR
jgi:hypothetical protein